MAWISTCRGVGVRGEEEGNQSLLMYTGDPLGLGI